MIYFFVILFIVLYRFILLLLFIYLIFFPLTFSFICVVFSSPNHQSHNRVFELEKFHICLFHQANICVSPGFTL